MRDVKVENLQADLETLLARFVASGISHEAGHGLEQVIDYQDKVGRATPSELRAVYEGMDQDMRCAFIWACCACLGPETAQDVIKYTALSVMRAKELRSLEEYFDEESKKLSQGAWQLKEAKKGIHKRLEKQRYEIAGLKRRLERSEEQSEYYRRMLVEARGEARENREDAKRYQQIKALLS
jgi:enoyl-CoA hydratase/carnithine racemase